MRTLSGRQLIMLLLGFCLGSSLVLRPESVGRSGWIASLVGASEGMLIALIYVLLSERFRHAGLVGIFRQVFGPVIGLIPTFLLIWFSVQLGGLVLEDFGEYFNIAVLQATPVAWFVTPLMLACVYVARKGPGIIARCSTVLVPVAILIILALVLLLIPTYRLSHLLPLLVKEDLPAVAKSVNSNAMFPYAETVVFLAILPNLRTGERALRPTILGLALAGLVLSAADLRNTAALGSAISSTVFPSHAAARLVDIDDVLTRVEILVAINFLTMGFLKVSVLLYSAASSIAETFKMSSYRPLVLPVGLMMVILTVTGFRNGFAESIVFASETWSMYAPIFAVVIPLITLLAAILMRKPRRTA